MITPNQVSLIIPTYNRQEIVFQTLQYIKQQSISGFEVVLVDQTESNDSNLNNFKDDGFKYKYLKIKETGLPNARNVGAENAKGDILIFIDDDSIPDSDLIQSYMNLFNDYEKDKFCIGGRIIEKNTNMFKENNLIVGGWITWYGKTLKNFDTVKSGECEWASGGNFGLTKDLFIEAGGFDPNFIGTAVLEDGDFGYAVKKIGGRVYYYPEPVIEHLRIPTGGVRQNNPAKGMFYRAHNTVYFFRKYGRRRFLCFVFVYLNGIAMKEWIKQKHGLSSFIWTWIGFYKGLVTKLNK
jgi:GT2 family glycosyltransferase